MGSTANISVGSLVWVEDPVEAWLDGEVMEVDGKHAKVQCSSGKTVVADVSTIYPEDTEASPCGVDDMTKLAYLHEPGVLQNLKSRFEINEIYTYTGNILIAVNPFRRLPHLYNSHMMQQYSGAEFGELSPHPFAVADVAYRLMMSEKKNQSILVSGESGAGKTESTKMLMRYLAYMGGKSGCDGRTVEQQVLESNPVLEAFGNAKTVRNNNSSRFGKFVEIQFDQKGKISGAAVRTYLLERSRVCQVSDPERNYHCFYMLCAAPPEDIERYKVGDPTSFHYLNQSNCISLDAIDDAKEYLDTRRAMEIVGINSDEQDGIFRIVSAILHLGNVNFSRGDESDTSKVKDEKSRFHLKTAAELFMCDEKSLENSFCKRVIVTRGETITKSLDPVNAALSRDALAKNVYLRLFDWLVNKINNSIGQDPNSKFLIGVLDIYGFESFKINSFEQFCINLTNEKLQQHFNQHVFKMEQEEYTKEEIDWSYIEFIDNKDILELIEKRPGGIIALLDEACMFPRSTHETFAQKMYQTFKGHKRFKKPKLARTDFSICHYAGDVTYQTDLFLEKNKDYVVAEHQALLCASSCVFVSSLFPPIPEDSSKTTKFVTIGTKFKQQLHSLMETLNTTEPHYIRCVKPNNLLKPSVFENSNVLQQLRCGGVLEAIRISCAGYPTRRTFFEFVDRYRILAPEILDGSYDEVSATQWLLEKVNLKGYQIGKTKIFLRAGQLAELDALRNDVIVRAANIIQRRVRLYLSRRWFISLQSAAIQIQAVCRGELGRECYEYLQREAASLRIQTYLRMHLARKSYRDFQCCSITIQSGLRGMVARDELRSKREKGAAIIIQSQCRQYLAHVKYTRIKKATITTQCMWRGRVARIELRKLKMAAKETGALQAAKNKLEKQVEELTWRLQLEKRMRADMEEAKTQENAKLHSTIQEMQLQFNETKESLIKDRNAAKKETTEVTVIKEVPTIDTALVEKLSSENEKLKSLVNSLEKKIDETEKKFEETSKISEERLKKSLEAGEKIINLNKAMQSLEVKLSNLESEDQILRQRSLISSTVKPERMGLPTTPEKKIPVNGNEEMGGDKETKSAPAAVKVYGKFDSKMRKSYIERQHENVDTLIRCIVNTLGFSQDKPVAAFTIYKCLLHWNSFEAERTNVFDRLVSTFGLAIKNEEDNNQLAYWLSNMSTLLFLLQHSLKAVGSTSHRKTPPTQPQPQTLFGRMTQGFRSSTKIEYDGPVVLRFIEARYPALLFKQQLTAYVEKIYGIIRDNVKKELSSLLSLCIQAPKTAITNVLVRGTGRSFGNHMASSPWQSIIDILNHLLRTLQENHVPDVLIQKMFTQVFSFINVQLFNSLLLRRECCTFSNGEYVKASMADLELWCARRKQYAGSSWEELKHIRQSVGFLVIFQKSRISYDEIANDLCPVLSVTQLYKICTQYWDDKYNSKSVSPTVLSSMGNLMSEDSNTDGNAFLLDDNSSIPFSVDELSSSLNEKDFLDVKTAEELHGNPNFPFLQE